MSNVFKQLIIILDEAGVSPDRVGQVETEEGCEFENDAPLIYTDEDGSAVVVNSNGEIINNGVRVAQMESREDAWYQAQEMIWCASKYSF